MHIFLYLYVICVSVRICTYICMHMSMYVHVEGFPRYRDYCSLGGPYWRLHMGPKDEIFRRWTPHPVIVSVRDNADHTRVLVYHYYRVRGPPKIFSLNPKPLLVRICALCCCDSRWARTRGRSKVIPLIL